MTSKQLLIFSAITDILKIFADTEIGGQYDFNYDAIADYLNGLRVVHDFFEYNTKEEIYERFTEDIYNGYPVWRMLKLPKWTADMIEKSFTNDCAEEYENMKKTYKCLTCKFYKTINTSIGILEKCTYEDEIVKKKLRDGKPHRRNEGFTVKKKCKNYIFKEENNNG